MRKLFTIMLSILLLVGCTKTDDTPKYSTAEQLEPLISENIILSNNIQVYEYTNKEELEIIKNMEPYQLDGGGYISGEDTLYQLYGKVVLLEDLSVEVAPVAIEIFVPEKDGTYLADFKYSGKTYAFVFQVGSGVYQEPWTSELCMEINDPRNDGVEEHIVLNGQEYLTTGEMCYYLGSLSYSIEPVEGDYFNDFDLYVAPYRSEDYTVNEFRNGNEVHFNDQVVYITEPITEKIYSILYTEPQNVMEVLGITRENLADCIIYDLEPGPVTDAEYNATARSVKGKETYQEFLDKLFTLEMYDAPALTTATGAGGHEIELVLMDGTRYKISNISGPFYVYKNGENLYEYIIASYYITQLVRDFGY